MINKIIVLAFALAIFASGCTTVNDPVACTADAKLCPDGSAVGRDPLNGCAFYACPGENPDEMPLPVEPDGGIGITDPYTRYASSDSEECKSMIFTCIDGSNPFFDGTGCGCRADEPRIYVSKEAEECSRIRYTCEENYMPFSDSDGCGCEFYFPEEKNSEEKLMAIVCEDTQREAEVCTTEYSPVCGWFSQEVKCIRYPCAAAYSNSCNACADEKVDYYTPGECPSGEEGRLI